ncbi:hypothetical protein KBA63_00025 [Candidatus Woesebacteria bacterium]|nr:hypothetical protein [Candidatus Woesebacteria bacterium]
MDTELQWKPLSVVEKSTKNIIQIKDFKFNPEIHEMIEEAEIVKKQLVLENDEAELRAKAKELGIKSWHVKNIENLKQEINQLQNV